MLVTTLWQAPQELQGDQVQVLASLCPGSLHWAEVSTGSPARVQQR